MPSQKLHTIKMQKILVVVSVILFLVKLWAWWLTASVAILTDTLESIVNVVAGFIGLYSIILSSKPRDRDHPYGHGKVEFISSAIEGVLILLAGLLIIIEASNKLVYGYPLRKLDSGLILLGATAIVNYVMGHFCVVKGRKEHSPILVASGAHLKSDSYSTFGILVGISLIIFTGMQWIDIAVAFLVAAIIIFTSYRIIRRSVSGMMDESDTEVIGEILAVLKRHKLDGWIDVHNMRVIDYAGFYHIDCHLTVPYYIPVNEAHELMEMMSTKVKEHFGDRVEFFVHIDGCLFSQCPICSVSECPVRKHEFTGHLEWTVENAIVNKRHTPSES